jgi:formylglycine-generating enzyme required for sulfatase activity
MSGNTFEFVADGYSEGYYSTCPPGVVDPRGPDAATRQVVRGGAWVNLWPWIRVTVRKTGIGSTTLQGGFRCAYPP